MRLSFPLPELATEIVTVAGDVGVHEGGRGQDHRRHPDEEQHQRSGLENIIKNFVTDGRTQKVTLWAPDVLTEPQTRICLPFLRGAETWAWRWSCSAPRQWRTW